MNIIIIKFYLFITIIISLFLLSGCGKDIKVEQLSEEERLWQDRDRRRMQKTKMGRGLLTDLFKGKDDKKDKISTGFIGADNPIWRASLETLSKFPLSNVDAGSGIIITEWYISEKKPSQRFKITVLVVENVINANSVQVSIHKQVIRSNKWVNSKIDSKKSIAIERKIIQRAIEINSNT